MGISQKEGGMTNNNKVTWSSLRSVIMLALALIIALSGVFIAWGVLTQRIEAVCVEQTRARTERIALEARVNETNTTLVEIQVQLAEIQRDILYIRERMAEEGG